MNPSLLVLVGAFDTLIAIIQNDREVCGKSFDREAALQTLKKVKAEFVNQLLASARAQVHATETFRTTLELLLANVAQGSDLQAVLRELHRAVVVLLPQGPTPPWPSSSSSSNPLGL